MNITDAENVLKQFEELQRLAAPIATLVIKLKYGVDINIDADDIMLDGGQLYVDWEIYHSYDDTESRQSRLPLEYIFDPDWITGARKQIQKKEEDDAKKEQARFIKAKLATVARERKQYFKLKEQVGE